MTKIKIQELREAVDLLLNDIASSGQTEIVIDKDYYWSIKSTERYDPYNTPSDLTLGQLSQDVIETAALVRNPQIMHNQHLSWVSAILVYIAEKSVIE